MSAMRTRLPDRRPCERIDLDYDGRRYHLDFGLEPGSGRVLEVFIAAPSGQSGSRADQLAADAATLISIALQHGVPVETMRRSIARVEGRAATIIGASLDALAAEAAA